jgi:hypothetical protein
LCRKHWATSVCFVGFVLTASLSFAASVSVTAPSPAAGTTQVIGSAKGGNVVRVEILIDGAQAKSCNAMQCIVAWNTLDVPNGRHRLQAKAMLRDGRAISSEREVVVQNDVTAPAPAPIPQADVVPSSLTLGASTLVAGGTTTLALNVTNRGTAAAQSVSARISLAASGTTSQIANISVGTLLAGASATFTTILTAPMSPATYMVIATIATPDSEANTTNNTTTATLAVSTATAPAVFTSSTPGCNYYASPGGTGDGLSASTPFRVQNFWAVAGPGKTLCLLDGTYQGDANMIGPPAGKSGISGSPIYIRAFNDGAVVIDGQFQRRPVTFVGNSWWVLEGFNAKQGTSAVIYVGRGSNNNIFRRIVAWDAYIHYNSAVFSVDNSDNNLVEDVGLFGTGGRTYQAAFGQPAGAPRNIGRRVWARYEGAISQVFAEAITLNYGNFQGATCENCLATYTVESLPENYYLTDQGGRKQTPANNNCLYQQAYGGACPQLNTNYRLLFRDQGGILDAGDGYGPDGARFFGSLGYIVSVPGSNNVPPGVVSVSDQLFAGSHIFAYVDPNFSQRNSIRGFHKQNPAAAGTISHISSVTTSPDAIASGNLTVTDHRTASTLAGLTAAQNPWTGTSGAQLCYRWVNESVTTTPLWPWPMNERIRAATASAGNYFANGGPGCGVGQGECTGTFGHVRTATDVTADIEALLGSIPPACRQ